MVHSFHLLFRFFCSGRSYRYLPNRIPNLLGFTILVAVVKTVCNYLGIKFFEFDFIFALVVVLLVYHSKKVSTVFASPPFLFLGKISFPLYLIHVPIIALLAPRFSDFASVLDFGSYGASAFIFLTVSFCVLFVSWVLTLLMCWQSLLAR